jgi:hypothetical protein
MTETTEIKLDYPLENGVTVLNMRRPKIKDLMIAEQSASSEAETEMTLFANLCGITTEEIYEVDLADHQKMQTVYKGFLDSKQPPQGG